MLCSGSTPLQKQMVLRPRPIARTKHERQRINRMSNERNKIGATHETKCEHNFCRPHIDGGTCV